MTLHRVGCVWVTYTLVIIFLGGIIIVFIYASSIDSVFKLMIKLQKVLFILFLMVVGFYRNLILDVEIIFIGAEHFYSFKLDLVYYINRGDRVPELTSIGCAPNKLTQSMPNLSLSSPYNWMNEYLPKDMAFFKYENFFEGFRGCVKKGRLYYNLFHSYKPADK